MTLHRDDTGSCTDDTDPGEPSTGHPRVSVTVDEAKVLALIAHGRIVLEIGTGLGVSTRALHTTARCTFTLDVDPWVHDNIWPELRTLDYGGIVPLANRAELEPGTFDLVFIDGDHTTEQVTEDVRFARMMLKDGGVIAVHDVHYTNVREGLKAASARWVQIETFHGIGLIF